MNVSAFLVKPRKKTSPVVYLTGGSENTTKNTETIIPGSVAFFLLSFIFIFILSD